MRRDTRIYVAGGTTLLGHALIDHLRDEGFTHLIGVDAEEPDLTDPVATDLFFSETKPELVFHCAGMSGGIEMNRARPVELMRDNLLLTMNLLSAAHRNSVPKLLYLASSCVYPKNAPQPMSVESLGTGLMEQTSEAYSTAKLAGWKLCEAYRCEYGCNFIAAFPTNSFGPHDDFSLENGHVIPALIRRTHEAKQRDDRELMIWGTGKPRREFLYSRDLARACLFIAECYEGSAPINLGGGIDISIADLAREIAAVVGYRGSLRFDETKPDGAPFKRLDPKPLLDMGWRPAADFRASLTETYNWFLRSRKLEGISDARRAL
jgi:GDP-L-fucose synthase